MGARTHINYLKAFRTYRDMIRQEADSPTYQAILSSFNLSLFGTDYTPGQNNDAICGGDGESEDEVEAYRRKLKQDTTELPPDSIDIETDTLPPPSPAVSIPESLSTHAPPTPSPAVSTPAEPEAEESPVAPKPKKRPAPRKKKAVNPETPAPESTTPDDSTLGDPDPSIKGNRKKKAATPAQPNPRSSRTRAK